MGEISRDHHYVPKCILKRFANSDGYLHGYLKAETRYVRRRPKRIFFEPNLHSQVDENGIVDDVVERQISKFESKAAPILDRLVRCARLNVAPRLSQYEYDAWTSFFLFQWKRAPEFHAQTLSDDQYKGLMRDILSDYENEVRPLSDFERERFADPAVLARMRHNLRAQHMLRLSPNALRVIRKRGIALVRVTAVGESLLIGSNPVLKLTPDRTTDLEDHEVEVWLPVAPDVLVGIGTMGNAVELAEVSRIETVKSINDDLFSQSSIVAGRSRSTAAAVVSRNNQDIK